CARDSGMGYSGYSFW
nr:immunoglobulin heavy chain junction region [Macaca mulatta]MOW97552.1 immunoglobulin heavy chain junction region [Macaca mulatta]